MKQLAGARTQDLAKFPHLRRRVTGGKLVLYRFNIPDRHAHLLASFIFRKPSPLSEFTEALRNGHRRLRHNDRRSHAGQTTLKCNRDWLPALAGATGWVKG